MPKCDKCGKNDNTVVCYEGYGVGIRLCPSCEVKAGYLKKMQELNDDVVVKVSKNRQQAKAELVAFKSNVTAKVIQ